MKPSITCALLFWFAALAHAQPDSSGATDSDDAGKNQPAASLSPMMARRFSSAQPSPDVAPGSIEVEIVDVDGRPVKGADVSLAILKSGGTRREQKQRTNTEGKTTFAGLQVGRTHAYLVRLFYQRARFQSPPFQLSNDRGFKVLIRRLETTRNRDEVVVSGGQLSIWREEDRLEIGQTVRLNNTSQMSYVFPESGLTVQLPQNYQGLEPSPVMGDQRLTSIEGRGFTITGSLMPGETTLAWKFSLPVSDSKAKFSFRMPWNIVSYRVVADASSGMTLDVEKMPSATVVEEQGQKIWVTGIDPDSQRAPLRKLEVEIGGILGSGYSRWIAAFLSLAIALIGLLVAGFTPRNRNIDPNAFAGRKAQLLDRAVKLKTARQERRIAERRYKRGIDALVDELSDLMEQNKREQLSRPRSES